jgi:hypothetical protein
VKLRHERVGRVVPDDRGVGHAAARRVGGGPASWEAGETRSCSASTIWRASALAEGSRTHTGLPLGGRSLGSDEGCGEGGVRTGAVEGRRRRGGEGKGRACALGRQACGYGQSTDGCTSHARAGGVRQARTH